MNAYLIEFLRRISATSFTVLSLLDTTCFGLTGHLQVYRLLWLRILPLTVMEESKRHYSEQQSP
jgi:hypothetical protein